MPQFVKILAKVTKRLQALVSVEITRSIAAGFWPIVAVCMRRFERPQRVGKRWQGRSTSQTLCSAATARISDLSSKWNRIRVG